jgi:hypothetical protein
MFDGASDKQFWLQCIAIIKETKNKKENVIVETTFSDWYKRILLV